MIVFLYLYCKTRAKPRIYTRKTFSLFLVCEGGTKRIPPAICRRGRFRGLGALFQRVKATTL